MCGKNGVWMLSPPTVCPPDVFPPRIVQRNARATAWMNHSYVASPGRDRWSEAWTDSRVDNPEVEKTTMNRENMLFAVKMRSWP